MAMTDQERHNLVNRLRFDAEPTEGDFETAADEIERLAARVQQLEQELELVLDEKRFAND
jgi:HAMP domain-containing protein